MQCLQGHGHLAQCRPPQCCCSAQQGQSAGCIYVHIPVCVCMYMCVHKPACVLRWCDCTPLPVCVFHSTTLWILPKSVPPRNGGRAGVYIPSSGGWASFSDFSPPVSRPSVPLSSELHSSLQPLPPWLLNGLWTAELV